MEYIVGGEPLSGFVANAMGSKDVQKAGPAG